MLRSSCGIPAAVGAEHLQRGLLVDVVAAPERLDQRFLVGEVRQHPQLDLRVVRRNQHVTGSAMKARRISRPSSRANRDVLQVRVAAAQPSGRGHRLVEARMDAAGLGVHELRQRVDVGAFQLHQPAPLENHAAADRASAPALRAPRRPWTAPSTCRSASAPAAAACRTGFPPAAWAS